MSSRIRPQAEIDVSEIAERIALDRPATAHRILANAADMFDLLSRIPGLGSQESIDGHPEIRSITIKRFPNHVIFYLPLEEGADIARVVDGRRDLPALFPS